MNNDTTDSENTEFSSDSNNPQNEANMRDKVPGGEKIKEYGKKSMAPLIDLVSKYRGEIFPYFDAIGKGLQGAVNALNTNENQNSSPEGNQAQDVSREAEQAIAGWFTDASEWFEGANQRLKSGNARDLLDYLEQQAQKHPAMMFSSSYIAGLVFGRIGRHLGRQFTKGSEDSYSGNTSFQNQDFDSDSIKH